MTSPRAFSSRRPVALGLLTVSVLRSEEAMLAAQHAELVARRNRLEAESRAGDAIRWDAALARLAEHDAGVRAILDGQRRLLEARGASIAGHERRAARRARPPPRGLRAQDTPGLRPVYQ